MIITITPLLVNIVQIVNSLKHILLHIKYKNDCAQVLQRTEPSSNNKYYNIAVAK